MRYTVSELDKIIESLKISYKTNTVVFTSEVSQMDKRLLIKLIGRLIERRLE